MNQISQPQPPSFRQEPYVAEGNQFHHGAKPSFQTQNINNDDYLDELKLAQNFSLNNSTLSRL